MTDSESPLPKTAPPFTHPRRDPHFRKARFLSSLFLSVAQAAWFIAFVAAIEQGTPLNFWVGLLGLAGLFIIAGKTPLAADLALGVVDRTVGLESAPGWGEIARRFIPGILIPYTLLGFGFAGRDNPAAILLCLGSILFVELLFRLLGMSRWQHARIHTPTLKALLTGSLDRAVNELGEAREISDDELEASALAVAGVAIREKRAGVLEKLEEQLAAREKTPLLERIHAVVKADYKRLTDPENAAAEEAEALRRIPPGHPRRLALGLFVATAALDAEDPASARKALELLHTRDVVFPPARVIVDWLLLKAGQQLGDNSLVERCRKALNTFNLRREAMRLSAEKLKVEQDDSYTKWMRKASEELVKKGGKGSE